MKWSRWSLVFLWSFIVVQVQAQQAEKDQLPRREAAKQASDTIPQPAERDLSSADFIEIDKLIVDETISKAGRDFLDLFFAQWRWPAISNGSFMMVIEERPFRGISTQIVISVNDLVVFESFLQTRYDYLEELSAMAIDQITTYLYNYELIMKQLEGEDMQGNGIY